MRAAALAFILSGSAVPVLAMHPVTVAQLEQMLLQQRSAHKSDSSIVQELSEVKLSEELTAPTLKRITAESEAGPQTAQALDLLADESALLAPPAAEIPADPRPDMAAQRNLFTAAVDYVVKTIRSLPDFLAVRETRSFDDSPLVIGRAGFAPLTPLHLVGTFRRDITYREGKEVIEAGEVAAKSKSESGPAGLTTWGEFGPVLAIILGDSLKGRVTWSRWEQGPTGRVAVFHYAVPQAGSNYHVDFCCAWQEFNRVGEPKPMSYHGTPGYHGELYLDPSTGAIMRVTLEAELSPDTIIRRAAISVQYGPVEIGGANYICPIRSIAISQDMARPGIASEDAVPLTRINETDFVGYHRFGSASRILAGNDAQPPAAQNPPPVANSAAEPAAANAPQPREESAETSASGSPPAASPAAGTPSASEASPPAASHPSVEATSTPPPPGPPPTVESNVPETPAFKTAVRDVVLDVVVTKNNGDPVPGLTKQEFAVSEDGQAQSIDFFEEHAPGETGDNTPPEMPPLPSGAVTNVPPAAMGDAVSVLLLDSLNTPPQDQANVQREILDFAKKMKPGTRVAVFTLGTRLRFIQGFTSDSSVLLAALKKGGLGGEKNGLTRSDAADDAADIAHLRTMQESEAAIAARQDAQSEIRGVDVSAHVAMTLEALSYLAQYLAGVPGRKNLLWFSSSFPVVIFPSKEESKSIEKSPALRESFERVKQTADLFSAAQISVYPIDAEGVMNEHVMEADTAGPGSPEGSGHGGGAAGAMRAYNAEAGGRGQVVDAMEQLAASTGGKAFYNTNDLNSAMQKAIDDGAHYYTIGYSPTDKTMDGSLRRIDVKVTRGKYKLAYRTSYNAEETPASDPQAHVNPLTELLDYGLPAATGILYGVDARAGQTEEASDSDRAGDNSALQGAVTRYRVDFTIRAGDVDWKAGAQGGRIGRLLIGLKAYDNNGRAVNWDAADETLQVKEDEYAALIKSGIPMHLLIDLPVSEEVHLVTAIYDWNSGKAGTLEVRLTGANNK